MGNIVLVHGAWGGGWCWDAMTPDLRDQGHEVRTPDLHRGTLDADTAAVQDVVDELGGPAVVAGWSYGGQVITGLRLPEGSRLVYIGALMPDDGETAMGTLQAAPPTGLAAVMQFSEDGAICTLDPDDPGVGEALWADAATDLAAAAAQRLCPQATAPLGAAPGRVAWKDTPSTYVVCTQDNAVHPDLQRRLATTRATETLEWDCSHAPMLSRPAELVAVLGELASSLPAS